MQFVKHYLRHNLCIEADIIIPLSRIITALSALTSVFKLFWCKSLIDKHKLMNNAVTHKCLE